MIKRKIELVVGMGAREREKEKERGREREKESGREGGIVIKPVCLSDREVPENRAF